MLYVHRIAVIDFFFWLQEKLMINTLQFNVSVPTPYVFMRRFLKAAESDKKVYIFYMNNEKCYLKR